MRAVHLLVLSLALGACGATPTEASPADPAASPASPAAPTSVDPSVASVAAPAAKTLTTQSGTYELSVVFDPPAPEMGALFDVVATVVDRRTKEPLVQGKVTLNARMPQHGHGMETDPAQDAGACDKDPTCPHEGGVFRTKGFKFHMGGEWTVTVEVVGASGTDSTSFVYELK
jgi:hypothetical protein